MSEDLLAKLLERVKSDPPKAGSHEGGPSSDSVAREAPVPRNVQGAAKRTKRYNAARRQKSAPEGAVDSAASPAGTDSAKPAGDSPAEPAGDGPAKPAGDDPAEPVDEKTTAGNIDWLEPEADGLDEDTRPVIRDRHAISKGAKRHAAACDADGTDIDGTNGVAATNGGSPAGETDDAPAVSRSGGEATANTAAAADGSDDAVAGGIDDAAANASRDLPAPPLLARTAAWLRSHEEAPLMLLLREGIFAGFVFIVVIMLVLGLLGVPVALTAAVAGYFGGRRAGDPVRAAIAALLPFLLLVALFSMVQQGWLPGVFEDDVLTPQDLTEELQMALGHDSNTSGVWGPLTELPDSDSTVFVMVALFAVLGGLSEGMLRRMVERVVREQQGQG